MDEFFFRASGIIYSLNTVHFIIIGRKNVICFFLMTKISPNYSSLCISLHDVICPMISLMLSSDWCDNIDFTSYGVQSLMSPPWPI
jgi:hypothetical protein